MGLDMYLEGRKFHRHNRVKVDGFEVSESTLDLGYWRKHPNLHGFIVETFAEGRDECQDINLYADDIRTIIEAVENANLPPTSGFFFGASDGTEKDGDLKTLKAALAWLETPDEDNWRSIVYRASW